MDLTEAEDIKKRGLEYTEELYKKKNLNDPDNQECVITHLEADILLCDVKYNALGSIIKSKASRNDGITAGLFQT